MIATSPASAPTIQPRGANHERIDGHADRDEEEAEQQPLERLDVDLDVVAVLGLAEQEAGEERAERGRQAGRARSGRDR